MKDRFAPVLAIALVMACIVVGFMGGRADWSKMRFLTLGPDNASGGGHSIPGAANNTNRGAIGGTGPAGSGGSASTSGSSMLSPMLNRAQETGGTLALIESTFSNNATAANKTVTAGNAVPSGTNSSAASGGAGQASGNGGGSSGASVSSGGGSTATIAASGVKGRPILPVTSTPAPAPAVAAQPVSITTGAGQASGNSTDSSGTILTGQASGNGTDSSGTTLTGENSTATIAARGLTLAPLATFTWSGDSSVNQLWSNGANWAGTPPTSNAATALIFAGTTNTGTAGTPLNQNIATPFVLNTITFSAAGGTFFLGGNSLQFNGASDTITQSSSSAESIANVITAVGKSGNNTETITLTGSGTGVVTLSGNILVGNGARNYAITKSGTSTFVLSGTNTYTGATMVSAGTLLINGNSTAATGAVTVTGSGTVLGGTGTVGGAVTVASGAIIEGGNGTTGTTLTVNNSLTMNSGSIIELALGPGLTHSTLARTGTGTWTFATAQMFTFINLGATPGTYENIITGLAGSPPGIGSWTITNAGFVGTFSFDPDVGGIDLTLTAVPEPSTWIGGALAFAALALMQRRRFARALIGLRPLIQRLP